MNTMRRRELTSILAERELVDVSGRARVNCCRLMFAGVRTLRNRMRDGVEGLFS